MVNSLRGLAAGILVRRLGVANREEVTVQLGLPEPERAVGVGDVAAVGFLGEDACLGNLRRDSLWIGPALDVAGVLAADRDPRRR